MISICQAQDVEDQAGAIAEHLGSAYQATEIHVFRDDDSNLPSPDSVSSWDDLLVVVLGTAALSEGLKTLIRGELEAALAEARPPRLLPISTDPAQQRPPAPLQDIKAIPCVGPQPEELDRIRRRVGAFLGLWLRGEGKRIFVSYRAADGFKLAEQVAGFLQQQGYDALRDEEWLKGGDVVQQEIERHLEGSNLILLLDTPRASESEWIKREIDGAIHGFVPILPVVLRSVEDRRKGPSFRALKELDRWVDFGTELEADGTCRSLTDLELSDLLDEMEEYLTGILRTQMMLPEMSADSFAQAGFSSKPLASQQNMYEFIKPDEGFATVRILAHCTGLSPVFHRAVEAFRDYVPAPVDDPASQRRYNYRIFLHDASIPAPELEDIANAIGLPREAQLRVFDLLGLEMFLRRFRDRFGMNS